MPVTEHTQRCAARVDTFVTAQLAFALNGYNWDALAEKHRHILNREAILQRVTTPLMRYCLMNDCEVWECLAAVLNRFKRREDGSRQWSTYRMAREVFNGKAHPDVKTPGEIFQSVQRRLFLPKPVHTEVIQYLRMLGLTEGISRDQK